MGGECIRESFGISLLTEYYSRDQIKKNEVGWACSAYGGEKRVAYTFLVGRHEGKRPFGRPRLRRDRKDKGLYSKKSDRGTYAGLI
jgi:hypothetical protein